MKPGKFENLVGISALEYLNRSNLPQSLKSYLLSVYSEGYFEAPPDRVSAAAMIRAVQQTANFGGGRYYQAGVGSVFQGFAHAVERYNGTVLFGTRVEKILVDQHGVIGIQTGGTQYSAPIVISNTGIQPTVLKLIGADQFELEYVEWVKNLEMNLANVGYRWFLDKPLLTSPMNVFITYNSVSTLDDFKNMERGEFPDHSYVYLGTTSLYPGLAPQGKQIVYACMSCLGDPEIKIEPYLEQVRKIFVKMQPDILNHIERETDHSSSTKYQRNPAPDTLRRCAHFSFHAHSDGIGVGNQHHHAVRSYFGPGKLRNSIDPVRTGSKLCRVVGADGRHLASLAVPNDPVRGSSHVAERVTKQLTPFTFT